MYTISEETADEDLPKYWESVIARVNEKTSFNLNQRSSGATIDQVILKIVPLKDDKPEAHEKAKKIWKTTLICVDRLGVFVQRFGAFAAQAASTVFGPSQQCFNAINFVISAAQQYKEVFANITTLMERISVFLENLNMYMNNNNAEVKLDRRLRKTVYRVLEHFVEILGTTYKLTTDWKARIKLKAKSVAFGEDEGIKASLTTLETLISDFTGAQISMIVQDLSDAARNIRGVDKKLDALGEAAEKQTSMVGKLGEAEDKRTAREQEAKDLETIKKALGIDESKASWDRHAELWDSRVPGTGQWLINRAHFSKWADPKMPTNEVLTLKSPSGFGKSYLCSIVTQHLRDMHRGDSRVVIAHYYFQKDATEKSLPVNKAAKTLIWQFCKASRSYAKLVVKLCDSGIDFSNTIDLWKKLVTDLTRSLEITMFLAIDGIDELDREPGQFQMIIDQIRRNLSSASDRVLQLQIRMFITGASEIMDPLRDTVDPLLPEINLESPEETNETSMNESDLRLYIEHRMSGTDRLQKIDDQLKERIKNELARGARGSYSRLDYMLDDLVNIQNTSQIEDVLKGANQSLSEVIGSKIASLNTTLNRDEIAEINVLLSWAKAGYEDLSVRQFEAILALRADGQPLGLEERIRKRFAELLDMDESKQVSLRAGVEEYFAEANESAMAQEKSHGSPNTAVQEAEIALVRKILRTHFSHVFGDPEVYTRFGFDEFFETKLGDQAVRIRLNVAESHIKIAQDCLAAICDRHNDAQIEALLPYAYYWFVEHLGEVNVKDTEVQIKDDVGRKLVRLLQESTLLESWWAPERMYLRDYVVYTSYSKDLLKTIHTWLKDPVVQKGMSPNERQWVNRVTSDDNPSFELYKNIAILMARRWFESQDEKDWGPAFSWLRGYILSLRGGEPDRDDTVSADIILEIEQWAREQLGNGDQMGKWHGTAAVTLWACDWNELAATRYRQAIELRPSEWTLQVGLAEVLAADGKYDDAIKALEACITDNRELLDTEDGFIESYWQRMLHDIADWNIQKKELAVAETTYREILNHGMQQHDFDEFIQKAAFKLLAVLNGQDKTSECIALLDQISSVTNPTGTRWDLLLFMEYAFDREFHNHLHKMAKRANAKQIVFQRYDDAIQAANDAERRAPNTEDGSRAFDRRMDLQRSLYALKWSLGTSEDQTAALEGWEHLMYEESTAAFTSVLATTRVYIAHELAPCLLAQAKATDLNGMTISRLEKLASFAYGSSLPDNWDPKILLARAYNLAGDRVRAQSVLREYLQKALGEAEARTDPNQDNQGFYKIGMALQAMDDDLNAIASWRQYVPKITDTDEQSDEDGKEGKQEESEDEGSHPTLNGKAQVYAGAERTMGCNDEKEHSDDPTEGKLVNGESKSEEQGSEDKAKLTGTLENSCDGACGVTWTYADDMYICKDCLDIQFDPICYRKLKAGELDVSVCGADHNHIRIPPFNEAEWRSTPKDQVVVNGKSVPLQEWFEGLKGAWQLDEESLKAKRQTVEAANKIQRVWKIYQAMRTPGTASTEVR